MWRARAAALQLACSLLVLLGGAWAALTPGSTLVPNNVYYYQPGQDQLAVFAQGVEFQGRLLANTSAASQSECAAVCAADPECDLFGYTDCAVVQVRRPPAMLLRLPMRRLLRCCWPACLHAACQWLVLPSCL